MTGTIHPLVRTPRPLRPIATAILVAAFATTACGGREIAPNLAGASPPTEVSATTASAPTLTGSPARLPGGRLVFNRDLDDRVSVFVTNPDGSDARQLLSSDAQAPRWSPDGRHVSVVAEGRHGLLFVGLVDADGSDYVQFDSPDATLNLACSAWSPDASRLACEGWDDTDVTRNGIYTVRAADGGGLIRVTTGSGGAHDIPGDYSPDGRQIVFVRGTVSTEADTTLMVVEVDGSDERKLTDQDVGLQSRWSPDGQTILTDADGSLLLVPVDGRETSTIEIASDASPYSEFSAGWSPDGEWIVFSGATSTGSDLFIVRADGTNLHQVTDTPGQWKDGADWSR